jgi:hypothetical protein
LLLALVCRVAGMGAVALLCAHPVFGSAQPCDGKGADPEVDAALARIRLSTDPCGESSLVAALLEKLERCTATSFRICTSLDSDRNWFDRPDGDPMPVRTISWNPGLTTPIELGCEGDASKPVLRDATASLLHELAHAAQDCDGLDPADHELEAVRIENIYRRAAGLCQRRQYGAITLPPEMIRHCEPRICPCTAAPGAPLPSSADVPAQRESPPQAPAGRSADAQPASAAP